VTGHSLHSEDGGSMDLWNIGILPQHYMASQPTKPRLAFWKTVYCTYQLNCLIIQIWKIH